MNSSCWRRCKGHLVGVGLLILLLTGCSRDQDLTWKTHNITGLMPDLAFTLTDTGGQPVTADDFQGKIVMLYFGYAHCPDVCPTTVATAMQAIRKAGAKAEETVRFLFVSVDPDRDPPAVLGPYVKAFGSPSLVGLTGSQAQLKALAKRYRVAYSYEKPDAEGNYAVNHSAAIFVFDRQGQVHLVMNYRDGVEPMAHDLSQMVAGAKPARADNGE